MGQKLVWLVCLLGVGGLAFWNAGKDRAEASEAVLAEARKVIAHIDDYPKNKEYIDGVMARAHEPAFSASFKSGRRGRRFRAAEAASFNEDKYMAVLFMHMRSTIAGDIAQTGNAGERARCEDVQRDLEALKKELKIEDFKDL